MKKKGARLEQIERLYRERYRHFLRVARAVVGDEAAAHDAVQDGFSQAICKRDSYRGDGPLEAWIWRSVVYAAIDVRRRRRLLDPFETIPETATKRPTQEDDDEMRAWVVALPERQRLAIFLRYYADLDYRAIAEALGIEVGTVSATLSAAHSALRRLASASEEVSQ